MLRPLIIATGLKQFFAEKEPKVWALSIVIGIFAGYAAIFFRELIGAVQWIWLGTTSEYVVSWMLKSSWWVILLAPTLGGLVVGLLLQYLVPGKRAHGVSDVMESQALHDSRMPEKTAIYSSIIHIISLGTGASAGREGPVVHLGAALSSFVQKYFQLPPASRRILLACGVASAVSASFNVPIAGVLFAHELILRHYALRAFVPITLASITGAIIIRTHYGDFPTFRIPHYEMSSNLEFPAFALLGIFCALVAVIFHLSLLKSDALARKISIPLVMRPVIGGLSMGIIGLFLPQVIGVGYDTTDAALKQEIGFTMLIILLGTKILATSITLASRMGGGVFSPSLYLGAMAGGIFGIMAGYLYPDLASSHGLYAIAGMGAVAAAILGAPISTSMIAFELTGDYNTAIVILLAVSIASALHNALMGGSFFHSQLLQRGVNIIEGPHQHIMRYIRVVKFMEPVASDLEKNEILSPDENWYLKPCDTLETALQILDNAGRTNILVIESEENRRVIGTVNQVRALKHYNEALVDAHIEGHR